MKKMFIVLVLCLTVECIFCINVKKTKKQNNNKTMELDSKGGIQPQFAMYLIRNRNGNRLKWQGDDDFSFREPDKGNPRFFLDPRAPDTRLQVGEATWICYDKEEGLAITRNRMDGDGPEFCNWVVKGKQIQNIRPPQRCLEYTEEGKYGWLFLAECNDDPSQHIEPYR